MIFDKAIYAPNYILIDAPFTGIDNVYATAEKVMEKLNLGRQLLVICAADRLFEPDPVRLTIEQEGYKIYREMNLNSLSLSGRLWQLQPKIVYNIQSTPDDYKAAISNIFDLIGTEYPVLCISDQLSTKLNPALIVVPEQHDKDSLSQLSVKAEICTLEDFQKLRLQYQEGAFKQLPL